MQPSMNMVSVGLDHVPLWFSVHDHNIAYLKIRPYPFQGAHGLNRSMHVLCMLLMLQSRQTASTRHSLQTAKSAQGVIPTSPSTSTPTAT